MLENETMLYLVLNTSSLEKTLQSLQASDNYLIRRRNTSKYTRNDFCFYIELNCRDSRSANYFSNEPIVFNVYSITVDNKTPM